jgi:hypothetical protein
MNQIQILQFASLTIILIIGLAGIASVAFRVNIYANWDEKRCDPYVVPIAGFFKPPTDRRSAAAFAADNWRFCQKEYVQSAVRTAAQAPQALVTAENATVGVVQDIASISADIFFNVWNLCHSVYASFTDRMKTTATLFRNFMIKLHDIIGRIHGSITAIIFSLISLIVGIINSIHVAVIVVVIVVGILIALQIILFMLIWPISALLATVAMMVNVVVISVAAAIAAAVSNSERFATSSCFANDVQIVLEDSTTKSIQNVRIGDPLLRPELESGVDNLVTAVHEFSLSATEDRFVLDGIRVTGDHMVFIEPEPVPDSELLIPVRNHPDAQRSPGVAGRVWCLTTKTRTIPCMGRSGITWFADWEEFPLDDTARQTEWFNEVWKLLNGFSPLEVSPKLLTADSGIYPDSLITVKHRSWFGGTRTIPIKDVQIGDTVFDSDGPTQVVGKVLLEGDFTSDLITVGSAQVSPGTWVYDNGLWVLAGMSATFPVSPVHARYLVHLYTASGSFLVGTTKVRDASDVGLFAHNKVSR